MGFQKQHAPRVSVYLSGVVCLSGACLPLGCLHTFRVSAYLSRVCLPFGCLPTFRVLVLLAGVSLAQRGAHGGAHQRGSSPGPDL